MSKIEHQGESPRYTPYCLSFNITPYNPLDKNDIKNENSLTRQEKYILDSIRNTESELTNKRRRRGLKRGRPKSERKKVAPRSDQWLLKLEADTREDWFSQYWSEWFNKPETYFDPWPWDAIKGSLYAATVQQNSQFYVWIICGRKEDKYTSTVGAILKKLGEPFKSTQKGTILVLITMSGTQIRHVINILNACKRDKTLKAKVVIALQYAVKYKAVEIELDEAIFRRNTRYYIPEVSAILCGRDVPTL